MLSAFQTLAAASVAGRALESRVHRSPSFGRQSSRQPTARADSPPNEDAQVGILSLDSAELGRLSGLRALIVRSRSMKRSREMRGICGFRTHEKVAFITGKVFQLFDWVVTETCVSSLRAPTSTPLSTLCNAFWSESMTPSWTLTLAASTSVLVK